MEFYYQNETLYINVSNILNEEMIISLKRRIFRIIDDYEIDHIVLNTIHQQKKSKDLLYQLEKEYHQHYNGRFLIK